MHHRGPRLEAPGDLRREARALTWIYDFRRGLTYAEIAASAGYAVRTVREEIRRARPLDGPADPDPGPPPWIRMIPLFPCASFTPQSSCPHHGSIPDGSRLVCMVCHDSGLDARASTPPAPGARAASRPRPEPGPRGAA